MNVGGETQTFVCIPTPPPAPVQIDFKGKIISTYFFLKLPQYIVSIHSRKSALLAVLCKEVRAGQREREVMGEQLAFEIIYVTVSKPSLWETCQIAEAMTLQPYK